MAPPLHGPAAPCTGGCTPTCTPHGHPPRAELQVHRITDEYLCTYAAARGLNLTQLVVWPLEVQQHYSPS